MYFPTQTSLVYTQAVSGGGETAWEPLLTHARRSQKNLGVHITVRNCNPPYNSSRVVSRSQGLGRRIMALQVSTDIPQLHGPVQCSSAREQTTATWILTPHSQHKVFRTKFYGIPCACVNSGRLETAWVRGYTQTCKNFCLVTVIQCK